MCIVECEQNHDLGTQGRGGGRMEAMIPSGGKSYFSGLVFRQRYSLGISQAVMCIMT